MIRRWWLMLVLPGCAPGVSVEWTDGPTTFDEPGPALWFDSTQRTPSGLYSGRAHWFAVSDGPGTCDDWRAYFEVSEGFAITLSSAFALYKDVNEREAACERLKESFARFGTAVETLQSTKILRVRVNDARFEPPSDGTYVTVQEDPDAQAPFSGELYTGPLRSPSNPLADIDCAVDPWFDLLKDALSKSLYGPPQPQERFRMTGGTLTLAATEDDAYELELAGASLVDDDNQSAGVLDLEGRFDRCEIEVISISDVSR